MKGVILPTEAAPSGHCGLCWAALNKSHQVWGRGGGSSCLPSASVICLRKPYSIQQSSPRAFVQFLGRFLGAPQLTCRGCLLRVTWSGPLEGPVWRAPWPSGVKGQM